MMTSLGTSFQSTSLHMSRFSGFGVSQPRTESPKLSSEQSLSSSDAARTFLQQLNISHALHPPAEVEVRESSNGHPYLGVWATDNISSGTKFGPFLGKWSLEPINPNQAWEVRGDYFVTLISLLLYLNRKSKSIISVNQNETK